MPYFSYWFLANVLWALKKKNGLCNSNFFSLLLKNTVRRVLLNTHSHTAVHDHSLICYDPIKHILCAVRQGRRLKNFADANSACIKIISVLLSGAKVVGHEHPIITAINVSIYFSYIKEKCFNFLLGSLTIWIWREIVCTLSSILQSHPVNICTGLRSWIPIN